MTNYIGMPEPEWQSQLMQEVNLTRGLPDPRRIRTSMCGYGGTVLRRSKFCVEMIHDKGSL